MCTIFQLLLPGMDWLLFIKLGAFDFIDWIELVALFGEWAAGGGEWNAPVVCFAAFNDDWFYLDERPILDVRYLS